MVINAVALLEAVKSINPIEAIGVITSIIGSFYITARNIKAFVFWMIGNAALLFVMLDRGVYLAAAMYLYYIFNSLYGYLNWKKLDGGQSSLIIKDKTGA